MKVVLFGATGMIGSGVLLECLDAADVTAVLSVTRRPGGIGHPKLEELVHEDFMDYTGIEDRLAGFDACFFCLGISAAGLSEARYRRVTVDITKAAAEVLSRLNPAMTFCYVSGAGADSSEGGRIMWARVKGTIENELLRLPFAATFLFRPAYVQPRRGVTSSTRAYRILYRLAGPLYPALNALFPRFVTTTEKLGTAMLEAVRHGFSSRIIENQDINALAALTPS